MYGIRNGTFFVGALALLAVSLVWGALWVATGPESSSAKNLRPRTQLARASWVVGVVLAVLLVIAAVLAD